MQHCLGDSGAGCCGDGRDFGKRIVVSGGKIAAGAAVLWGESDPSSLQMLFINKGLWKDIRVATTVHFFGSREGQGRGERSTKQHSCMSCGAVG